MASPAPYDHPALASDPVRELEDGIACLLKALRRSADGLDRPSVDSALRFYDPAVKYRIITHALARGAVLQVRRMHAGLQGHRDHDRYFATRTGGGVA